MEVKAGMSGSLYIGKTLLKSIVDDRKDKQCIWDNFNNSFSGTELGQEMVVGAAFGRIGKAAF